MWGEIQTYINAALIFALFFGIAEICHLLYTRHLAKIAEKTRTEVDEQLIKISARPLFYLTITFGAYMAAKQLTPPAWVNHSFIVLFVLCIAWLCTGIFRILASQWFLQHQRKGGAPRVLQVIIGVVMYLSAIIIVLSYFDIAVTPFVAALGIGGLAIGLALQDTLSNFFAGLHIVSDEPVRVGDFIELPDAKLSGYVEDIGWRSTRIRQLANTYVILPNAKLAESVVINDYLPNPEMAVLVQCSVDGKSDLEKVERVTVDVARNIQITVPGAKNDFVPFIRYHTFDDGNINFTVILRAVEPVAQYIIKHEFIKALRKRYAKERIEIGRPMRRMVK